MAKQNHDNTGCNRRDFFKKAAVLGLGAAAGGSLLGQAPLARAEARAPKAPMPRRPFGRSGTMVSVLSLGGMFDILNNRLMLKMALDWGVNYWDTAEGYGGTRSEEGIGRWFAKNPGTREEVFLVTKLQVKFLHDFTPRLEASLKRLNTDHVDLFFVHGISNIEEMTPQLQEWGQAMKKAGKIRLFGFSTHSNMETCLEDAAPLPWIDGVMFTYNYRLMHEGRMRAAVEACHQAGIGLTAMKTMGGGPVKSDSEAEENMAGRFMKKGFSDAQAKLMAVWEDSRIASICSQMPNLTILAANAAAAVGQVQLSQGDRALLARHAAETCGDYCAGCGELCSQAIGQPLPVSDVMRYLMYYRAYQDPGLARDRFAELPGQVRRELARADFSPAEAACPRRLPIGQLMREAVDILA
ncbi:MAG: aldo/keto reductase [Desulfarculus sp.]|nr:aldo/keto reductase [Desulfarculus sp.]